MPADSRSNNNNFSVFPWLLGLMDKTVPCHAIDLNQAWEGKGRDDEERHLAKKKRERGAIKGTKKGKERVKVAKIVINGEGMWKRRVKVTRRVLDEEGTAKWKIKK